MTSVFAVSKIVQTCLDGSDFVLTESQLATSQMLRSFCEQVVEFAPICGMVLGQMAAPIVRLQSARFFNPFLGKTASHIGSWVSGMVAEGFLMAATPKLIHEKNLGFDVWRGTVHGTATMMVCGGVARIPLGGGLLAACGQDLGLMLVNWGCGELTITEKVQGGFVAQCVEARVSSMRIACSAGIVRASCVEVSMMKAKYELNHQLESNLGSRVGCWGFKRLLPSFSLEQEFAANNGMRMREILNDGPSKEEAAETLMLFMSRKSPRQGNGWQGTYLKRIPQSRGTRQAGDNRKIALQAAQAMQEALTPKGFRKTSIKNPYKALSRMAKRDIYRYEAMMEIIRAMRLSGMTQEAGDLEALLDKPKVAPSDFKAVQKELKRIVMAHPEMREAYQRLLEQQTLRDYLLYAVPNGLTAANVVLAVVVMSCLAEGEIWKGLGLSMIGGFSDKLDGFAARKLNKTSIVGQRADSFADGALFIMATGGLGAYEILKGMGHPYLGDAAGSAIAVAGLARLLKFDIFTDFVERFNPRDMVDNRYDKDGFVGLATTTTPFVLGAAYSFAGHSPALFFGICMLHATSMLLNLRCPKISDTQMNQLKRPLVSGSLALSGTALFALAYYFSEPAIIGIPTYLGFQTYLSIPLVQAALKRGQETEETSSPALAEADTSLSRERRVRRKGRSKRS